MRGLPKAGWQTCAIEPSALDGASFDYILFHYDDKFAREAAAAYKHKNVLSRVICLSSDIYDFDESIHLCSAADAFMVPTVAHKTIIDFGVNRPVYVLPESIDPVVEGGSENFGVCGRHVLWFGYAESFHKGTTIIAPVLRDAVRRGNVEAFELSLNSGAFHENADSWPVHEWSEQGFSRLAKTFSYSVLSHAPYDLAH